MYHYIIRSPHTLSNGIWSEVNWYWEYTKYKSESFEHLQDMLDNYKQLIHRHGLVANPQFFYKGELMPNSDDVYYGYDIVP